MVKQAITVAPASRNEALAAIWDIIDVRRIDGPRGGDVGKIAGNTDGSDTTHSNEGDSMSALVSTPDSIPNSLADKLIKRGISSTVVGPLGALLGVSKGAVAGYLGIGRRTASHRASGDLPLPTYAAEVVLRFLELHQMAVDVFASEAESSTWLRKPHPMLDGESPLQCARSSYGAQRVKDMLVATKYGGAL